jgi:hypothetical protein
VWLKSGYEGGRERSPTIGELDVGCMEAVPISGYFRRRRKKPEISALDALISPKLTAGA